MFLQLNYTLPNFQHIEINVKYESALLPQQWKAEQSRKAEHSTSCLSQDSEQKWKWVQRKCFIKSINKEHCEPEGAAKQSDVPSRLTSSGKEEESPIFEMEAAMGVISLEGGGAKKAGKPEGN